MMFCFFAVRQTNVSWLPSFDLLCVCFGAAEKENISEMDYPALISGDTVRAKVAVQSFVQLVCKEMILYHCNVI